jgi:medium-chain acyl-[acyl-carrier-protein] hydrolase
MAGQASPWFVAPTPDEQSRLRLFCFPYVGASHTVFRTWSRILPDEVTVYGVALPGRGRRILEAPISNLRDLVDELEEAIQPYLDRPYAFYGHSFGALVGFELARHLRRQSTSPALLSVSGAHPPQLFRGDTANHTLSDQELVAVVRRLGGTPEAVLENAELVAALLPAIRADYEALETYVYTPGEPFDFPILGLGGTEDPQVALGDIQAWSEHTRAEFTLQLFPGGHFFIHQLEPQVLEILGSVLTQIGMGEDHLEH